MCPSLVKIGLVLTEIFHYTETGTNVAGTNVAGTNVAGTNVSGINVAGTNVFNRDVNSYRSPNQPAFNV